MSSTGQRRTALGIPSTTSEPPGQLSVNGGLYFLFVVELFLLGLVLWSYLINHNVFPGSHNRSTDWWWAVIAIAAAGWGTWFLVQSRNAANRWDISYSRHLLAVVVASGAVLIGTLLVQLATALIPSPLYIDARPSMPTIAASSNADPTGTEAGDAANGKKWFGMSCVSCHGPTGDGVANAAPSLRTSDFLKTSIDQTIASLIRNGRAANDPANKTGKVMPAKGGNPFLDESKIADLVAFLKDLEAQFGSVSSNKSGVATAPEFTAVESKLAGQPVPTIKKWTLEDLSDLSISFDEASVNLGMQAFVKATCNKCHMAAVAGQELGPTLDQVVMKYPRDKLLQHIIDPSSEINEKFQSDTFLLLDGRTVTGVIAQETDEEIQLITDLLKPDKVQTFPVEEIDDRVKSKVSPMPSGLVDVLNKEEIAGLVAYMDATGNQLIASNAPQLNRWVVPHAETRAFATTWSVTKSKPTRSHLERLNAVSDSRYATHVLWLFGISTAVLGFHFLWVIGVGSAIVLNDILQLRSAAQLRLSQQVFSFWSIGLVWLAFWFVFFFLIG